ncbi:DUF4331 family protein [Gilvibacter sediminis]|uniref:DUF4331 family protein n=1 Tax=Gilvibacter sediminis TaxID=379071 RepID=UPI002350C579|nr:DUF4331 family protein [Gilvibacter sediminis]MDC7996605.1 DUF4331 family protein [Gilvibacter sediminis]
MKNLKIKYGLFCLGLLAIGLIAADHIDAPAVQGQTTDITDIYAFQGENTDNIVFVANLQGLLSPGATAGANFDENTLLEFNFDLDGDAVEDQVLQAIPRNGTMYFFGPNAPASTGLNSSVAVDATESSVMITPYGESAITATNAGMQFFAGPRDDPFFMDFAQYTAIINGDATEFNNPGSDTFAGSNVLSVVVEMPKAMLGGSGTINFWVTANSKQ